MVFPPSVEDAGGGPSEKNSEGRYPAQGRIRGWAREIASPRGSRDGRHYSICGQRGGAGNATESRRHRCPGGGLVSPTSRERALVGVGADHPLATACTRVRASAPLAS